MSITIYWLLLLQVYNGSSPAAAADYSAQFYYDIIKSNKVIGQMVCSKVEKSETIEYTTESSAKFSVIVDISVYNKLQSSFTRGKLDTGKHIRIVNGETKTNKQIQWRGDSYRLIGNGKETSLKSAISFTTACLMFVEPQGIHSIFSENFGTYVSITEVEPHKYALKLPDGKDNFYTYQNGKCVEVEVRTSLATVYMKPHKQ